MEGSSIQQPLGVLPGRIAREFDEIRPFELKLSLLLIQLGRLHELLTPLLQVLLDLLLLLLKLLLLLLKF
jgi:hypothetical protein